jgi:hypothetical protein
MFVFVTLHILVFVNPKAGLRIAQKINEGEASSSSLMTVEAEVIMTKKNRVMESESKLQKNAPASIGS